MLSLELPIHNAGANNPCVTLQLDREVGSSKNDLCKTDAVLKVDRVGRQFCPLSQGSEALLVLPENMTPRLKMEQCAAFGIRSTTC